MSIEELDALNSQRKGEIAKQKAQQLERRKEIMKLHLVDGLPMAKIGQRYSLSRQRVHQIINGHN
jgi:DNA-directed RNA polymerase specialized sigma subunit